MRRPTPSLGVFGRALGLVAIAAIVVAIAVHWRRDEDPVPPPALPPSTPSDPIALELARCQAIGMAAEDDADCKAAWAENRRRFFTSPPANTDFVGPSSEQKAPTRVEDR